MGNDGTLNAIELATELTIAWLGNHNTRAGADDVPTFLQTMYGAVTTLADGGARAADTEPQNYEPAVSVRKSIASKDHIISLIDGKPYRTLKRHLSRHGLTPDQYRERYSLRADYPMVAESYSEARSAMAKTNGLGRKPGPRAAAAKVAKTPRGGAKA